MPRTIVVMNGEQTWQPYFPGLDVVHRRLQDCAWVLRDGELWTVDRESAVRADGVLWRVGAIRAQPSHRWVLDLIRLSGVPCTNSAATLSRGFERLGMLAELREAGLPVVSCDVAIGDHMARRLGRNFPVVVKVGNHHAGLGKARVENAEAWPDIADLIFAADEYVTAEPFIEYQRDIRCLAVGDEMWAMTREGTSWKANVDTRKHRLVEPPEELTTWTRKAMQHLGADALGLDFLETRDGTWVLLESNDTPGLSGFPDRARAALADRLLRRMSI
jgi:ribosomal protein S6--L-glutamate ligase